MNEHNRRSRSRGRHGSGDAAAIRRFLDECPVPPEGYIKVSSQVHTANVREFCLFVEEERLLDDDGGEVELEPDPT